MASQRNKFKENSLKRESGPFFALPRVCLESENFYSLSAIAAKLFLDLISQYRGNNNGDLCATWSLMKKRNWRSQSTLQKAKNELVDAGWLIITRQGGRNLCTLYAFSFLAIDECKGKLDIKSTLRPTSEWKER